MPGCVSLRAALVRAGGRRQCSAVTEEAAQRLHGPAKEEQGLRSRSKHVPRASSRTGCEEPAQKDAS